MESIIHILIVSCVVIYSGIYVRGIYKGNAKPVLATWLFFSIATTMSFFANFNITGGKGLSANFFNLVDSFSVVTIFIIILFRKDTRKTFTVFEKYCVGAVITVFAVWLLVGKDFLTHIVVQIILVIAYLPSLVKLWKSKNNTEPLATWVFNFFASAFSLIIPIRSGDTLPIVYGIRATVSTLVMSLFILRNKYLNSKQASVLKAK